MRFGYKCLIAVFAALMQSACSNDGSSNPVDDGDSTRSGSAWNGEQLVDSRDGKTYKTIQIGDQLWMAENLNYKVDSSYCYGNDDSYCDKYGRLYQWPAAVAKPYSICGKNSKTKCNLPEGNVQGVCPSGWHLPTQTEFKKLLSMVGGFLNAGSVLKSTTGWEKDGHGTDAYFFSVLPAGFVECDIFQGNGRLAKFWSSSEFSDGWAYYMEMKYWKSDDCHVVSEEDESWIVKPDNCPTYDDVIVDRDEKIRGFSVRCLRDEPVKYKPSSSDQFFIDARDGQAYSVTKIGNQVWMAENLNYETDSSVRCGDYGLHYNWADAIGKPEEKCGMEHECSLPSGYIRGICPEGWHLPSKSDWATLIEYAGGEYVAGRKLKTTPMWGEYGTDDYGFSAFPAGYYDQWRCEYKSSFASFWTSTQGETFESYEDFSKYYAYAVEFDRYNDEIHFKTITKNLGVSVRCVKD